MGAVHLAPTWMFQAFDAVLAVDIGGTNIRAGVVQLNLKKSNTLAKAKVWKYSLWRHGDEENVKRERAIVQLGSMLKGLIGAASKKHLSDENEADFVVGPDFTLLGYCANQGCLAMPPMTAANSASNRTSVAPSRSFQMIQSKTAVHLQQAHLEAALADRDGVPG